MIPTDDMNLDGGIKRLSVAEAEPPRQSVCKVLVPENCSKKIELPSARDDIELAHHYKAIQNASGTIQMIF